MTKVEWRDWKVDKRTYIISININLSEITKITNPTPTKVTDKKDQKLVK